MKWFDSEVLPTVTFQLIPDRFLDNKSVRHLADSFHRFYEPPIKRINIDFEEWEGSFTGQNDIFWEIYLSKDIIKFYLTVEQSRENYTENQLESCWNKSTIQKENLSINFNPKNSAGAIMHLGQHYFLSLKTDKRIVEPLRSILEVTKSMETEDQALIQIGLVPVKQSEFYEAINTAHEKFNKGNMPQRKELNAARVAQGAAKVGAYVGMEIMATFATLITEEDIEPEKIEDPGKVNIMREGGLSNATKKKGQYHGYDANIRVLAESNNPNRKNAILNSISAAFRTINEDNDLVAKEVKQNKINDFINIVQGREIPKIKINKDYISTAELAKLIQLPSWNLQQEYPNIENIASRELQVPEIMTDDGILLGEITHKGETQKVYWPTTNYDELCLPRAVVGGMGSGKSLGFGAGFATDAIRKGFSAFVIDVSDGDMSNSIRDTLPKDFPEDHIIDLDFGNTEYPIPLNWSEVTNSTIRSSQVSNIMANQLVNYMKKFSDDSGNRTERYMKAAAKAVYEYDPEATLLEVILIMLSAEYRSEVIKNISNPRLKDLWNDFSKMKEGKRRQIVQPILNRFDTLIGNEYISNCIFQKSNYNIDFRKWADGDDHSYCVLLRVPKSILWEDATDALATYLIAKLWLAILTRMDQPTSSRRPAFLIMDEPHQFLSGESVWRQMIVESRKWRLGLIFMFHDWSQLPKNLAKIIKSAGPHYTLYSSSKQTFKELEEEIKPFEVEEALKIKTHYAINVVKAGNKYHQFLAEMAIPPLDKDGNSWRHKLIDRANLTEKCSRKFGRKIDIVKDNIYQREKKIY